MMLRVTRSDFGLVSKIETQHPENWQLEQPTDVRQPTPFDPDCFDQVLQRARVLRSLA